jgi:hypothetical protein
MSPFLIYFIAWLPDAIFEQITTGVLNLNGDTSLIPWWISLAWGLVVIIYCTVIAWLLYRKNKQVSTVKTSLIFLVAVVAVLLIVIILELTVGLGILSVFN